MKNQNQQHSHKIGGRRIALSGFALVAVGGLLIAVSGIAQAATSVGLGTADSFAVLAGAGITNTGSTTITGDIGSHPTTSIGMTGVTLHGTNHGGDSVTQGAKNDLTTAYNNAAGQSPRTTIATELGGSTLVSGVYNSTAGTFGITGNLKLDAQGNPDAVFIFQASSTLITADNSSVSLINGAQACNVFWQVGSSATLATGTTFRGTILASTSITLVTGATVDGRVLASTGSVTMDTNTITRSTCTASSVATPPAYAANVGPGAQGAVCPWGGQYNDAGLCVGTGTSTLMNPSATPVPSPTVTPVVSATPVPTFTVTPRPTPSASQVPIRPLGGVNTGDNSIG